MSTSVGALSMVLGRSWRASCCPARAFALAATRATHAFRKVNLPFRVSAEQGRCCTLVTSCNRTFSCRRPPFLFCQQATADPESRASWAGRLFQKDWVLLMMVVNRLLFFVAGKVLAPQENRERGGKKEVDEPENFRGDRLTAAFGYPSLRLYHMQRYVSALAGCKKSGRILIRTTA